MYIKKLFFSKTVTKRRKAKREGTTTKRMVSLPILALLNLVKMVLKPVHVLITSLLLIDTAHTRWVRGAWLRRRWS
jgi:hypothetical protein